MRMIDKDEAIKILCDGCTADCDVPYTACITVQKIIDMPTIEAEPVRHGRWVANLQSGHVECSNCGVGWVKLPQGMRYCQNCGAKMGGADDGGNKD